MHAAPPVRVALRRNLGWLAFVAACAALAALQGSLWVGLRFEWPFAVVAVAAAVSMVAAALGFGGLAWKAQPPGTLRFDGRQWHWLEQPGELEPAVDLHAWMLLRFVPASGARRRRQWIAASRRGVGAAWPALRAALYSSGIDAAVDPTPPVAPPG